MDVSTPCVGLCAIDPATGLCRGCRRTGAEIAAWSTLDEKERRAIMATLPARRSAPGVGYRQASRS